MSSFNQVTIIGYLGKNPDVLNVTEKGSFVRLSLATNREYKSKEGEVRKDVQWHLVYLNSTVGTWAASTLKKGSRIFVSGELRNTSWKNKEGQARYSTAIYAKEIKFLGIKLQKNECAPKSLDEESAYEKSKQEIDIALHRLSKKN
jgi:single-strand DNA-binding protein